MVWAIRNRQTSLEICPYTHACTHARTHTLKGITVSPSSSHPDCWNNSGIKRQKEPGCFLACSISTVVTLDCPPPYLLLYKKNKQCSGQYLLESRCLQLNICICYTSFTICHSHCCSPDQGIHICRDHSVYHQIARACVFRVNGSVFSISRYQGDVRWETTNQILRPLAASWRADWLWTRIKNVGDLVRF